MKRILAVSFSAFLVSTTLAAQSSSESTNQYHPQKFDPRAAQSLPKMQLDIQQSAPQSCPVSMRAKQSAGGDMVKVGPSSPGDSSPFQSIRLILSDGKRSSIVEARIRVHGLTDKARVVATPGGDGPAEMTRSLNVSFSVADLDEAAADLTLHGFTSIKSIDLVSLTYSDGSTWKSGQHTCRTVPDPIMLIGTR